MKRLFLSAAIALISISSIFAQNATENPYISVSASVNKEITPDEIFLDITINEKDNKGKISVAQQEQKMIKALGELGIDVKESLTVSDMGSTLKNNTFKKDNILVSKSYSLKITSAQLAAQAIESLRLLEIARVDLGKVSVSDSLEREVKNVLLVEAAQKAQENARILAEAVGCKAGKPIYIHNYYRFNSATKARIMTKAANDSTEEEIPFAVIGAPVHLDITKVSLSISVDCRFQMLDK